MAKIPLPKLVDFLEVSIYHVIKVCYSQQIPSSFLMISDKLTKYSGKSTCQIIIKVFQESFDLQIFVDLSVEK